MSQTASMLMLQWADSAFPSGRFTLSHGMEPLIQAGVVTASNCEEILMQLVEQMFVPTDLALLFAVWDQQELSQLLELDWLASACKPQEAVRTASRRVGKALALMANHLQAGSPLLTEFLAAPEADGNAIIVAALVAKQLGLSVTDCAVQELYAFVSAAASAAMRCGTIDFIACQKIIAAVCAQSDRFLQQARQLPVAAIGSFNPVAEVAAARHETAGARLFMT